MRPATERAIDMPRDCVQFASRNLAISLILLGNPRISTLPVRFHQRIKGPERIPFHCDLHAVPERHRADAGLQADLEPGRETTPHHRPLRPRPPRRGHSAPSRYPRPRATAQNVWGSIDAEDARANARSKYICWGC